MINFGYLHYLFTRYFPIVMSAQSAAFLIYYTFIYSGTSIDDMKETLTATLILSTGGWILLFMAEENLRKLMKAVNKLVESITKTLQEADDEDHNQV